MKNVEIYTDGACSGNPGPGGWAAILIYNGHEKELCGYKQNITNNHMELSAVVRALEALKERCNVTIYTDSKYVSDSIHKRWVYNWVDKGSIRTRPNSELWISLLELMEIHNVRFIWVKGHNSNEYNNRCDILAVNQYKQRGY